MTIVDHAARTAPSAATHRQRSGPTRLRQLLPLAVASAKRTRWGSVAACIASALLVVWLVVSRETATESQALTVLRWSAVLLVGAVASVLDDPTEDDLAGVVTPVWWRRAIAFVVVGVPIAAAWAVALTFPDGDLPWAALSLEAATLVLVGTAAASLRRVRRSGVPAALVAAVPPAVLLIVANFLPASFALMAPAADEAAWRAAHLRWGVLAALAALVLAVAARDRARRSLVHVVRPARPHPTTDPTETRPEAT